MSATVLGNRYEILRKVGDGGMAFVYEAKDQLLNRRVAVKVLRPEYVDDEEFLEKFTREAKAVASLSHPNIVNVYDVGEDGKVNYIIMEYVDGQNLKEIIQNEGTLDEYTALDITKQIAMALGSAHRNGIIHRDIKPHNILISNEGRVVKVADFGIAKAVSSSTMTNIGNVIGSVHYFSPEQAKGKHVSANADLYSLGIVLYEMIVGKVPFRGDSPISIALQHINDDIEFSEEEKVRIPQSIRTLISKMTEKNPDDRYQSAEDLIEDIDYIEKNIDLDFIKEYDDFATRKIDEREIGDYNHKNRRGIAPIPMPLNDQEDNDYDDYYDDEYYDEDDYDEYEDDYDEYEESRKERKLRQKREKALAKKKKDSPKARKRLKIIAAILIAILFAQIFLFMKFVGLSPFDFFNKGNDVEVPNVISMDYNEAKDLLEKKGLNIKLKSREYSSTIPAEQIISQDPENGTLKEGDAVEVVVSRGQENVQVPNVIGLTLTQAKKVLEQNDLSVGEVTYEFSSSVPEGTVMSQNVVGGSGIAGQRVNLIVSKKKDIIEHQPSVVEPETTEPPVTPSPIVPGGGHSSGNDSGLNNNTGGTQSGSGSNNGNESSVTPGSNPNHSGTGTGSGSGITEVPNQ